MSTIQRTASTPASQTGFQQSAPAKAPEASQKAASEPQDRVTLSSESETYNRPSTRQIFKALQGMHNPEPPRPPSAAEKKKTLEGLRNMVSKEYTDYASRPAQH